MLDTCQFFAAKYNLKFSTDPNPENSKTKCIFVCGKSRARQKPANLILDGKQLPWVESAIHLGHVLHQSGTMEQDIRIKRAIDESVDVRETFGFGSPSEVLRAVKLYVGSHYGSMLWDLGSDMATQYLNAWKTCVSLTWQAPKATHTYFVDQLLNCGISSVREDTMTSYTKFVRGLMMSPSMKVAIMCGVVRMDTRTTTGKNLYMMRRETGLNMEVSRTGQVREQLAKLVTTVPEGDKWRMMYLARLLSERGEAYYRSEEEDVIRLSGLVDSLCLN